MWDASRSADWGAGREELSTFAAAFQAGDKLVCVVRTKVQESTFEIQTESIDKPWGGVLVYGNGFGNPWKRWPCYSAHRHVNCHRVLDGYHLFSSSGCAFGTFVAPVLADRMGVLVRMVPGHAWTMAKKIGKWEQVRKKFEDVWRDTDHEDCLRTSNLHLRETCFIAGTSFFISFVASWG